jgi:hypothetical protein
MVRRTLTDGEHMNLIQARREVLAQAEAGNAVLLESGSGIGKSQIAVSVFEEIKARDAAQGLSWGFGTVFAATQTPPDLIGYQFKGERVLKDKQGVEHTVTVTDPSVPLWMISTEGKPAFMYDRFFLLIDEYGQGEADVKRAIAEIFLNGGTSPWYLPPGSIRLACTNAGTRYGVTKDFDFCIARRTLIHVDGDIDVWLQYADKPYMHQGKQWQTMAITKAWAATHPEILFEAEPKEQGPWCNPRQLCAVDRYLQAKWAGGAQQELDNQSLASVAGTIGQGAAMSLAQFLSFRLELPSYDEIVADPVNTPVPPRADLLLLLAYELAGHTKAEHLSQCITYMQRMPKDMAVTYVTSLLRRDYKGLINNPAMQGWINKNAALVSIIASLSH